jgi:excisionase family DNA binding protein
MLHVTLPTLDNMVRRGDIQAIHVGRRVLFDADAVDEAIDKGRVRRYKHQL